jgi:hypothetical protein
MNWKIDFLNALFKKNEIILENLNDGFYPTWWSRYLGYDWIKYGNKNELQNRR